MDKALTSLVLLKYDILTSDRSTWHLRSTYPREVQTSWAWRCAADVEHLTKGYSVAEKFVAIAKKFRDGVVTEKELNAAHDNSSMSYGNSYIPDTPATTRARRAMYATYNAAIGQTCKAVVRASLAGGLNSDDCAKRWDLYISWLIEELGDWEQTHG